MSADSVLVVGAAGFVGRNVIDAAAEEGIRVLPLDRRPTTDGRPVRHCDLEMDDLTWVRDEKVAIWCAGSSDHRGSWTDPSSDLGANVGTLLAFLTHFRGHLVLVSSAAVYHSVTGITEPNAPLQPGFPYAISKLTAELYARSMREGGRLAGLTVLRLFHPFGPGEPERRIIARLVRRFGVDRQSDFTVRGDGSTLMDVLPVGDVATAIVRATDGRAEGRTIDICRGTPPTLFQLAGDVAAAFGIDAVIRTNHATAEEGIFFEGDPEPGRTLFGLPDRSDLSEPLLHYAAALGGQLVGLTDQRTNAPGGIDT